jgi:hypothetical protein
MLCTIFEILTVVTIKISVFWDVMHSTLKMQTVGSSQTLVHMCMVSHSKVIFKPCYHLTDEVDENIITKTVSFELNYHNSVVMVTLR